MAASSTTNSRLGFLSLPAEVRNMVYELVFDSPLLKMYRSILTRTPMVQFTGTNRNLLRTCKTINSEARPLLEERTTLRIPRHLIRTRHTSVTGYALPATTHAAVESFARNLVLDGGSWICNLGELDLSAFQKLRRLEFKLLVYPCCIRKIFGHAPAGQSAASVLQTHWLDDPRRGWGLLRRIEQIEVEEDPAEPSVYNFRISLTPSRSGSRQPGQLLISYSAT